MIMAIYKVLFEKLYKPIDDGHFFGRLLTDWGNQKAPLPKICLAYPTMIIFGTVIPYPKKIKKNTYKSRDTPLEFC